MITGESDFIQPLPGKPMAVNKKCEELGGRGGGEEAKASITPTQGVLH